MKQRALVISLSVLAILLAGAAVVFAFGTPQAPPPAEVPKVGATPTATGTEIPAPDPKSPLAIQIPGCVCHSDDPALVEEHASYRMNQCFGCHSGGMPEMGQ
ncbi:MAG: hypothetical protein Q8M66_05045 [Actinomycetota bacterium]|nr:hypothetical protein [Actinomycetota bacterium]MDZ4179570.1 hypothetical protein [Coriobacteriia bacterium]